jgi:hypothetical protein
MRNIIIPEKTRLMAPTCLWNQPLVKRPLASTGPAGFGGRWHIWLFVPCALGLLPVEAQLRHLKPGCVIQPVAITVDSEGESGGGEFSVKRALIHIVAHDLQGGIALARSRGSQDGPLSGINPCRETLLEVIEIANAQVHGHHIGDLLRDSASYGSHAGAHVPARSGRADRRMLPHLLV